MESISGQKKKEKKIWGKREKKKTGWMRAKEKETDAIFVAWVLKAFL